MAARSKPALGLTAEGILQAQREETAKKREKAIDAYKKYLEALPKGPRAADARRHIAELTKQLRDEVRRIESQLG